MVRQRVTLADVAKASGVSPTTASLVLSGRGRDLRISRDAENRVRAAARELGYRRYAVSDGVLKGRTRTVGLIIDSVVSSPLAGGMVRGAVEAAGGRGFVLFTGESGGDPEVERSLVEAMRDRRVDGIVFATVSTKVVVVPKGLDDGPAVLLNALPRGWSSLPSVVPDEVQAGRSAARVLVEAGHREGVHLVGVGPGLDQASPAGITAVERLIGIREVFDDAGVTAVGGRPCADWSPENGYDATRELLRRTRPSALLCFDDRLAFGAYQALADAGLSVPEDVSVVSFDDHSIASWLRPLLTTVVLPHRELGAKAVEMLFAEPGRGGLPSAATVHRVPMTVRHGGSVKSLVAPLSTQGATR
ncbi:LacI family DNA-binding transcriptional regulator [Umezawaea endophytica]|uniref:LacI family DNA-binding transcriptional regulator n=1 Tax=Umezawaea endophytica TaxID=1654476 RepID=A0A9X2VI75_9PSEU|nr:LacI family DNA-binding transcriptional regulator [Umezawaea endophytica]MCS7477041.1 LacI family DNA-binding transcriptional regulator [Umezawaea endophytica]